MGWLETTMKRAWVLFVLSGMAFAEIADAPPAELLNNLDFFQSLHVIEQDAWLDPSAPAPFAITPSSPAAKGDASHD